MLSAEHLPGVTNTVADQESSHDGVDAGQVSMQRDSPDLRTVLSGPNLSKFDRQPLRVQGLSDPEA